MFIQAIRQAQIMWTSMSTDDKGTLLFCDIVGYCAKRLRPVGRRRTKRQIKRAQLVRTSDSPINRQSAINTLVIDLNTCGDIDRRVENSRTAKLITPTFEIETTGAFWIGKRGVNQGYRKTKPRMTVQERYSADKRYFEPRQYQYAS